MIAGMLIKTSGETGYFIRKGSSRDEIYVIRTHKTTDMNHPGCEAVT
jgi:hypothetical protein